MTKKLSIFNAYEIFAYEKVFKIREQANIYIWDEPLNYIDILTRIQIEEAILNYKPTLVFVEHDETFIEKVATKIINLEK